MKTTRVYMNTDKAIGFDCGEGSLDYAKFEKFRGGVLIDAGGEPELPPRHVHRLQLWLTRAIKRLDKDAAAR